MSRSKAKTFTVNSKCLLPSKDLVLKQFLKGKAGMRFCKRLVVGAVRNSTSVKQNADCMIGKPNNSKGLRVPVMHLLLQTMSSPLVTRYVNTKTSVMGHFVMDV